MHTFFQSILDWLIGLELCTSGGPSASRFGGGAGFRLPLVFFKGGTTVDASSVKTSDVYLASIPSILDYSEQATTETKADTYQAAADSKKKEAAKKGTNSTLLSGSSAAATSTATTTQTKSLLG